MDFPNVTQLNTTEPLHLSLGSVFPALRHSPETLRDGCWAHVHSVVHLPPRCPAKVLPACITLGDKQEMPQVTCALKGQRGACGLPVPAFAILTPTFLELRKILHLPGPSRSSGYPNPRRGEGVTGELHPYSPSSGALTLMKEASQPVHSYKAFPRSGLVPAGEGKVSCITQCQFGVRGRWKQHLTPSPPNKILNVDSQPLPLLWGTAWSSFSRVSYNSKRISRLVLLLQNRAVPGLLDQHAQEGRAALSARKALAGSQLGVRPGGCAVDL